MLYLHSTCLLEEETFNVMIDEFSPSAAMVYAAMQLDSKPYLWGLFVQSPRVQLPSVEICFTSNIVHESKLDMYTSTSISDDLPATHTKNFRSTLDRFV